MSRHRGYWSLHATRPYGHDYVWVPEGQDPPPGYMGLPEFSLKRVAEMYGAVYTVPSLRAILKDAVRRASEEAAAEVRRRLRASGDRWAEGYWRGPDDHWYITSRPETRETPMPGLPKWTMRPDLVSYVVDAYAGTEPVEGQGGAKVRRVFIWEEPDGRIEMGNTEAFVIHLGARFGLPLAARDASHIHAMLRTMGERVLPEVKDRRRSDRRTGWKQPEPDHWTIGRKVEGE